MYQDEYYFIRRPDIPDDEPQTLRLSADEDIRNRMRLSHLPAPGSAPFVFTSGLTERQRQHGIITLPNSDILFGEGDLVMRDSIYTKLLARSIPNLFVHPAIYSDDNGHWHEDYWCLLFTKEFDCHGRNPADNFFNGKAVRIPLNTTRLDNTPLTQRLLFKMPPCNHTYDQIVAHESILSVFGEAGANGAEHVRLSEYC